MSKFFNWLSSNEERKMKSVDKKHVYSERVVDKNSVEFMVFFGTAAWDVEEKDDVIPLSYGIYYNPAKHSIRLETHGIDADRHGYYRKRVLRYFNRWQKILYFYKRESIIEYVRTELRKEISVIDKEDNPEKWTIEKLQEHIRKLIQEEKYLEVEKYQQILDKKRDNDNEQSKEI